jgi:serine/threonine-protein kinase
MALEPGATLGPYSVTAKIGEGGMGEVYQARDTTLDRDVALKVLPEAFTADPDRLARFEREAKVLASLNHPNIAAIYGLEQDEPSRPDGTSAGQAVKALVLELVEGPTLADRIAHGALPIDDALPIARQIAEALDAAHEAGVIHRDLKPANIKVREDGTVKVLDFGLAKAFEPDPNAADSGLSPTMTAAASQMGMIVGTPAYMAPEQARGMPVDKRADIWSFGCLLHEMLTGTPVFAGANVSDILASVLRSEADWDALPDDVPSRVRQVLRACLSKEPRRRVRDIGDVRLALDGVFETATEQPDPTGSPRLHGAWPWVAGIALASLVTGAAVWSGMRPGPTVPEPVRRFTIDNPEDAAHAEEVAGLTLSRDGTSMVYPALDGGLSRLFLRRLDQLAPVPLPGTENGLVPFFSPDGESVAFFTNHTGELKRVSIRGGPVQTLGNGYLTGGTWTPNNDIVFTEPLTSTEQDRGLGLFRIPAAGGAPERLTTPDPDKDEAIHGWPDALPGTDAILFTVAGIADGQASFQNGSIAVLRPGSGEYRAIIDRGYHARYVRSGHVVYMLDGALMARRFDLDKFETTGPAVPVLEGVTGRSDLGMASYAVSPDGLLVYAPGAVAAAGRSDTRTPSSLLWVDRAGREELLPLTPRVYRNPRLSPDGRRVATGLRTRSGEEDLWVYDTVTGAGLRLTHDGTNRMPVWGPEGARIFFSSTRDAPRPPDFEGVWYGSLYVVSADGNGEPTRLTTAAESQAPSAVSQDGRTLIFHRVVDPARREILSMSTADAGDPRLLVDGPFQQGYGVLSPNGRWLAYHSNESGPFEVYVRPFPGPGPTIPVSVGGGIEPHWASSGEQLFYRNGSQNNRPDQLMAVEVDTRADFEADAPTRLGDISLDGNSGPRQLNRAPDGRFLFKRFTGTETAGRRFIAVVNWPEELKRLVPLP